MNEHDYRFGFRIVGGCHEQRRLIDWPAAFSAYASLDERAEVQRESYLSAFCFAHDFNAHLASTGSTAGFSGATWAPFLWLDVDRAEPAEALDATRRLLALLAERYGAGDDSLLCFYSGRKGYHIGVATALWRPGPGPEFHSTARRFAEHAAQIAGITIDVGTYARVQCFRAPNSRHAKTGRHKRRIAIEGIMALRADAIAKLADAPAEFEIPEPGATNAQAVSDWAEAAEAVRLDSEAKAESFASGATRDKLNRSTLKFIAEGAEPDNRHRLLFSAAANLAEFDATLALCVALLEPAALDSGLPPSEVSRQIRCGWASVAKGKV